MDALSGRSRVTGRPDVMRGLNRIDFLHLRRLFETAPVSEVDVLSIVSKPLFRSSSFWLRSKRRWERQRRYYCAGAYKYALLFELLAEMSAIFGS